MSLSNHFKLEAVLCYLWVMYLDIEAKLSKLSYNSDTWRGTGVWCVLLVAKSEDSDIGQDTTFGKLLFILYNDFSKSWFLVLVYVENTLPILGLSEQIVGIKNIDET